MTDIDEIKRIIKKMEREADRQVIIDNAREFYRGQKAACVILREAINDKAKA